MTNDVSSSADTVLAEIWAAAEAVFTRGLHGVGSVPRITTDPDALGYAFDPSVQVTAFHFLGLNFSRIHKFIS